MTVTQGSDAYAAMVEMYVRQGFTPYLLTFMFNQLPGHPAAIEAQMDATIDRLYGLFVTRIRRRPNSSFAQGWLPIWLLATDLPVYKRTKQSLCDVTVNGGLHKQGFALHPPYARDGKTLVEHFEELQDAYKRHFPEINEIHLKPVTHDIE